MKLYRFRAEDFGLDEWKCGSCNWDYTFLYWLSTSYNNAKKEIEDMIKKDIGLPLCGTCVSDMLVGGNYEIKSKKKGGK